MHNSFVALSALAVLGNKVPSGYQSLKWHVVYKIIMIVSVKGCHTGIVWAGRPGLLCLSFFLSWGKSTVLKLSNENARKQHHC